MKELIGYEIKKILMRRVNRIAMLFGLILIIFSNLALIHSESFPVSDTEYCTGREAFQKQAEAENALTTQLSGEFLTGFLQDYQQGLPTNAVTLREPAYCNNGLTDKCGMPHTWKKPPYSAPLAERHPL